MKNKFVKLLIISLCFGCIFSGCKKKEETQGKEKSVVVQGEEIELQTVGNESKDACHIVMTNKTENVITGLAVKTSLDEEFPDNMMKSSQKIENQETFDFYYLIEETSDTEEAEMSDTKSELADAALNATYLLQITFEDNTVVELSSFAVDDMEEATLCYEDEVYYLAYKSVSEKVEVNTKEIELMLKADKDAVNAVVEQISSLGEITLESESNVQSARTAYEALTAVQKEKVSNVDILIAAEETIASLKKEDTAVQKKSENKEQTVQDIPLQNQAPSNSIPDQSKPENPTPQPPAENPGQSEDGCLGDVEVNQPSTGNPEQSEDGCLGDVEINQPSTGSPEQSEDGCLGDVEINQ